MADKLIKYLILEPPMTDEKRAFSDGLKTLWMDIFHDSKAYIDLLYDNYLDSALIGLCIDSDNNVIASLTAIPYRFKISSEPDAELRLPNEVECTHAAFNEAGIGSENDITGWYLCGLSTRLEYRGRGLMNNIMKMAEKVIFEAGHTFTFLIPANDRLKLYYGRMGYRFGENRVRLDIKRGHPAENSHGHSTSIQEVWIPSFEAWNGDYKESDTDKGESLKMSDLAEFNLHSLTNLIDIISDFEKEELCRENQNIVDTHQMRLELIHSKKDLEIVLCENAISGGRVSVLQEKGQINSVALGFFDDDAYEIRQIFGADEDRMTEHIFRLGDKYDLRLYLAEERQKLIERLKTYFGSRISEEKRETYTMFMISENSIFDKSCSEFLKYPIFSNDGKLVEKCQKGKAETLMGQKVSEMEERGEMIKVTIQASLLLD